MSSPCARYSASVRAFACHSSCGPRPSGIGWSCNHYDFKIAAGGKRMIGRKTVVGIGLANHVMTALQNDAG